MKNIFLLDIALNRSKRLTNISQKFFRKLTAHNVDVELKAHYDYMKASDDNHETTMEMIERFK